MFLLLLISSGLWPRRDREPLSMTFFFTHWYDHNIFVLKSVLYITYVDLCTLDNTWSKTDLFRVYDLNVFCTLVWRGFLRLSCTYTHRGCGFIVAFVLFVCLFCLFKALISVESFHNIMGQLDVNFGSLNIGISLGMPTEFREIARDKELSTRISWTLPLLCGLMTSVRKSPLCVTDNC